VLNSAPVDGSGGPIVEALEMKVAVLTVKLSESVHAIENHVAQNTACFEEFEILQLEFQKERALRLTQAEEFADHVSSLQRDMEAKGLQDSNNIKSKEGTFAASIEGLNASVDKLEMEKMGLRKQVEDLEDKQSGKEAATDEVDIEHVRETFRTEISKLGVEKNNIKEDITRLIEMKITLLRELDALRDAKSSISPMPTFEKRPKNVIQLGSAPKKESNSNSYAGNDNEPYSPVDKKNNFFGTKKKKEKKGNDELGQSTNLSDMKKLKKSGIYLLITYPSRC
jgi:hypothetical protein